jgi:hypothetical protein
MTEVIVSVNIQDFYNVGALSLFITLDTLSAAYVAVENTHPAFPGLLYNFMTSPTPQIGFSWSGINGVNIPQGKFCDIRLLFKSGQSNLSFAPWCEVVTADLEEIPVNYTNGAVNSLISITQQPQSVTVNQGEAAQFTVAADNADDYQWQMSSDGGNSFYDIEESALFSGTATSELTITEAGVTLNGMAFRCAVAKDDCQISSEMALLEVTPPVVQQTIQLHNGWNGFSFAIRPGFDSLQALLDAIEAEVIFLTDGTSIYFPDGNLNTFQSLDFKKAFTMKVADAATAEITGTAHENKTIIIPQGWSLLPVLSGNDQNTATFFEKHASDVEIIKEVAGAGVFWPQFGINTLVYLRSGKGYYIKSKNSFTIHFND